MIAFTFGKARGSEGIRVPSADCRAAKSLLRSNIESRLFMFVLLERCSVTFPLQIFCRPALSNNFLLARGGQLDKPPVQVDLFPHSLLLDRKSTRLNSQS